MLALELKHLIKHPKPWMTEQGLQQSWVPVWPLAAHGAGRGGRTEGRNPRDAPAPEPTQLPLPLGNTWGTACSKKKEEQVKHHPPRSRGCSLTLIINITQSLAIKHPKDGDGDRVSMEGCVPAGMHPWWDGGFAASQPSLLQRYTNNHVGKIFHRTGMEINGLPEPSVYLFIPILAVRFLPYLNSISKALPLLI